MSLFFKYKKKKIIWSTKTMMSYIAQNATQAQSF